jgi:hypothetical protein
MKIKLVTTLATLLLISSFAFAGAGSQREDKEGVTKPSDHPTVSKWVKQNDFEECSAFGAIFMEVAEMRDTKIPPEVAFNHEHDNRNASETFLTNVVKLVYFDEALKDLRGDKLYFIALYKCMNIPDEKEPGIAS